jgi:uncharacterized protein (TIRG00374 family)
MASVFKKKHFWGTVIAIILLGYCVKDISLTDAQKLIRKVNFYYFIPAIFMEYLMIFLKAFRWKTIVEKTKNIKFPRVLSLYSAGQVLNIVLPALTGQVGRLLLFSKKENLSKSYIFSTIVIEVLFDSISLLIFILILSTVSFVLPPEYSSVSYVIAFATISLFVLLYLILHFKDEIGSVGRRLMRGRWPGLYITLKKFSYSFTRGIDLLRSSHYFFRTLLFSLLAWAAHVLVIYYLFKSFGFDLPLVSAILVMVINTLALLIPITPGNAGTFELVVVAALLAFGIVKSDAVLFALALHILDLLPIFTMGMFFFHSERLSIKEIEAEGEKEELLGQVEVPEMATEKDKI